MAEVAGGANELARATTNIRHSANKTHEVATGVLTATDILTAETERLEVTVHAFMQKVAAA